MSRRQPHGGKVYRGLAADKSLGQHFLFDPKVLDSIVHAAGALKGVNVIEIGAGPGNLTRAILSTDAASLTAIEIDSRAVRILRDLEVAQSGRLRVIEADAIGFDLIRHVPEPRAIIANLPYNVGTALLVEWLRHAGDFTVMVLMFQAEVAQRIVAVAGDKAYGRLAVLAALTTTAAIVLRVPPTAFVPPPKIDSAVVKLVPRSGSIAAARLDAVGRITSAAFGQRRKMLRSSLRAIGGAFLLEKAGIEPTRRAETLSADEYLRLADLELALPMRQSKPSRIG